MQVNNYYLYSKEDLFKKAGEIINWLSRNKEHKHRGRAFFALHIIQNSLQLERDDFINVVISCF
jgi:hypothetical protein